MVSGSGRYLQNIKAKHWILIVLFLILMLLCYVVYDTYRQISQKHIIWSADSMSRDQLDMEWFYIILFPEKEKNIITVGNDKYVLERGVLASLNEYRQQKTGVYFGNKQIMVCRNNLTAFPDSDSYKRYVDNFNKELVKWGNSTDWRKIRYKFSEMKGKEGDMVSVELTIKDARGRFSEYAYSCDKKGNVTPRWVKSYIYASYR